ncbi:MAG: UDP-N-acetylglucosamine 2-epimerase (non-hydrolyzing) [Chitinophagaceae bacterium]|nr:UDP-N-acetylglucosamine 2-epimerase (non-hydrolyzing) [Chitinophagaceae bacterium]
MIVAIIAGARPNFMKVAPIIKAIEKARATDQDIDYRLIHTGQHYDKKMSGDFFEQLGIPEPHVNLEAGGGSQAEQTAAIMTRFEKVMEADKPDVVLVVGDVTSTMACTIVAKKLCIPVVHVEAGIRSGDMTMPEEINRIVTDSICDHFFTTSDVANRHLKKSGVEDSRIHFVGNTMIDTLHNNLDRLQQPSIWDEYKLKAAEYYLVTLHRPANVDDPHKLKAMLDAILEGTGDTSIIFPVHPRTRQKLEVIKYNNPRLLQVEPMGYLEFIYMVKNAKAVITDSGGITEETTVLKVPCMTLRDSTERPETVTTGSNELVGTDPASLAPYLKMLQAGKWKKGGVPPLWDGKTAPRIVEKLVSLYARSAVTV